IELAIPRLLVLPRAQDEMAAFPVESLLGETYPHLLGAKRHIIVVKHQHWFLFVACLIMALISASTPHHRCDWRRLQALPVAQTRAPPRRLPASLRERSRILRRSGSAPRRCVPFPPFAPRAVCVARRHPRVRQNHWRARSHKHKPRNARQAADRMFLA